jgi:hypothetical protein
VSDLRGALAGLRPRALPDRYALVGYPIGGEMPPLDLADEPFAYVLSDTLELTLIVRSSVAERLPTPATLLGDRRVILLEGRLGDDLVGFMAAVTAALAERGVWLLALGAATRDHVLVADDQLDDALDALASLAGRNNTAP